MNRLIISAIGVILTFIWIVYTTPPRLVLEKLENAPIKKINKSGSTTVNKLRKPIYKLIEPHNFKAVNFFFNSYPKRQ